MRKKDELERRLALEEFRRLLELANAYLTEAEQLQKEFKFGEQEIERQ